jgi:ribosomal subunit interface protein
MKITVKWTNLKPIESMEVWIEKKIGSLEKFIQKYVKSGVAEAWVEISRTTRHHKKGDFVYRAEADIRLPNKIARAEAVSKNLRQAFVLLKDELQQQIKCYKGKADAKMKRGARLAKKMIVVSPDATTQDEWRLGRREREEGI